MSNVQVENKTAQPSGDIEFIIKRVVLWGKVALNGQFYSAPELKQYHTKIVDLYPMGNGQLAVFDGDYFICKARINVIKLVKNSLPNGQRVIVKKTQRYGVVNHQCGERSFYLVRLDGEISLRSFSGAELKIGEQQ